MTRLLVPLMAFATAVLVTTEFIPVGVLASMAADMRISLTDAGIFVTSFALAAAILGPILALMSADLQPHHLLTAALAVFAVGNLAMAWVPGFGMAVAVRVVEGGALPVFVSVGNATVARLAGAGREGGVIARINLGLVAVSLLGVPGGVALAGRFGWQVTLGLLGGAAVMALAALQVLFPTVPASERAAPRQQLGLLREPAFVGHLLLSGLVFASMFTAYTYLAAFLERVAHFDGPTVALALLGFGAAGMGGNLLAGRVVDRLPIGTTGAVAAVMAIATATLWPLHSNRPLLALILGIWGAAHAAAFVACQARVMRAGEQAPVFALSLNMSVCNLGIAAGSLAGGWIIRWAGVGFVGMGAAVLGASAVLWALLLRIVSSPKRARPPRPPQPPAPAGPYCAARITTIQPVPCPVRGRGSKSRTRPGS
jgi:DHA1 family inner membrane transport protein